MKRFGLSKELISVIIEETEGFLDKDGFDSSIGLLEKEAERNLFTPEAEANLIRIIRSMFDPVSFFTESKDYPHHFELLAAIAANSNFLTDIVVRNPSFLYQLFNDEYISEPLTVRKLSEEAGNAVKAYKTFTGKTNYLRLLKRRLLLRTGVNDMLGRKTLKETTAEISAIASVVNGALLEICIDEIFGKKKIDRPFFEYALCSLGKLGGGELNYSSDVDLILFYDGGYEQKLNGSLHEILCAAILLFIQTSVESTDKGFLYRVDFRLRPDGRNSVLCRSMADYLRYYETRGEDWERQALLKLGFVSGSRELYENFRRLIRPFIFPSSFAVSPRQQVKKMKELLEKRSSAGNVKEFSGGIRDIEFSVQALQLINGADKPELWDGNTLSALDKLAELGLLTDKEKKAYEEAYIFYRRIEHFLQLMNDAQTHTIPESGESATRLIHYLGFDNSAAFIKVVEKYRKRVKAIFTSIIMPGKETHIKPGGNIKFEDPKRAEKNMKFLSSGIDLLGQKQFDSRTSREFENIRPELVKRLSASRFPDVTLDNFSRIISQARFQSIWYREFRDEKFFNNFLSVCEWSQKACNMLTTDRSLGELLLTRRIFENDYSRLFGALNTQQIIFLLSAQLTLKLIDYRKFSALLSGYFKSRVKTLYENISEEPGAFMAGLGSFGSDEMTFASDIDLIAAASDEKRVTGLNEKAAELISEISEKLYPYNADFRLRPEGKTSPLVFDVSYFEQYASERMQTWEFQAMNKLSFIAGDIKLFERFKRIVLREINDPDENKIAADLVLLHDKGVEKTPAFAAPFNIKRGSGGLMTIDYCVDLGLLTNPELFKKAFGKNTSGRLELLKSAGDYYETLKSNFAFFRKLALDIQNLFDLNKTLVPGDKQRKLKLAAYMGLNDAAELDELIRQKKLENIEIFKRITGRK